MTASENSRSKVPRPLERRVELMGVAFDLLTEQELAVEILDSVATGRGGWLLTPNLSIMRQLQRRDLAWIQGASSHIVPDGQPLQWLARAAGAPLGPRATGAGVLPLVLESLPHGTRVLLLGGPSAAVQRGAEVLTRRGTTVVGAYVPAFGFDSSDHGLRDYIATLASQLTAPPDVVVLALPFPRQEFASKELQARFPHAYYMNTGAALAFWTGAQQRAPLILQRTGLEWAFRLLREPRRLGRRYLLQDAPFLARQLLRTTWARLARRTHQGTAVRSIGDE